MKVGLLGFGVSNRAVLKLLLNEGHEVFVSEAGKLDGRTKEELENFGVEYEEGGNSERLLECDIVFISPGVKPSSEIVRKIVANRIKITTELQFFLDKVDVEKVIGVTGTNGKSTTTALIHHALSTAGKKAFLGGNFGTPAVEALNGDYDYYVVEVSSFQLFWCERPRFSHFVLLNVAENHLDWHSSFEEYVNCKFKPAFFQKSQDFLVYNKKCEHLADIRRTKPRKIPFWCEENDSRKNVLVVHGREYPLEKIYPYQMRENILASALVYLTIFDDVEGFLNALESFKLLPHRMEYLGSINGVHFYNDSKATSTHAVLGALENFDKVVLIMCGIGKNENYAPFFEKIKGKVKHLVVFGEIAKDLKPFLPIVDHTVVSNLEEAFKRVLEVAKEGDVVLFSPGGASFDMYRSYAARGEHFREVFSRYRGEKVE